MSRSFDRSDQPSPLRGSEFQSAAGKPKPLLEACKAEHAGSRQSAGLVTYRVMDMPTKPKGQDRRDPPRKRTRLRCGKILDRRGKFLIECQVHDRSSQGAQLRLMGAVALPRHIQFFDDEQGALVEAEVIWRQQDEIGVQFRTKMDGQAVRSGRRSALGAKYYAVT